MFEILTISASESKIGEIAGAHVTDWIGAIAALAASGAAVWTAWRAYDEYLRPIDKDEQGSSQELEHPTGNETDQDLKIGTKTSSSHDGLSEEEIRVFKTQKQETFLTAGADGLVCRLVNKENGTDNRQWRISPSEARRILESDSIAVNPGPRNKSGRFTVGPRRNWLYSKKLFPEAGYLKGTLEYLLKKASGDLDKD
ncbi:MAG: hypothetical protein ABJN65_14080 [Parasphingorhabdus sp.]